ncbi:MAG: beta-propeller fold lactonase family protein [Acholeplasmataceae bacterium]
MKFLVGTYTKNKSEGIYLVEDENITLQERLFNPSYIAVHDDYIFTIARGGIEIYLNNDLIYEDHSEAKAPSHIFYEPTLKMIFTANYGAGQMSSYKFDGAQTKKLQTIIYPTNSHAHQAYYSQTLNSLLVVDLGLDTIFVYEVDKDLKLVHKRDLTLQKGVGPRHLVVSEKGDIYCLTEHSHEIYHFNNKFEFVRKYQTLDRQFSGVASAAIKLTNDNKHLYISNRGYDTLTHFIVNNDGSLTRKKVYNVRGKHPRDFGISLDETHIVVGNLHSNNLSIFSRNEKNGELKFLKHLYVPEPTCILFIP